MTYDGDAFQNICPVLPPEQTTNQPINESLNLIKIVQLPLKELFVNT